MHAANDRRHAPLDHEKTHRLTVLEIVQVMREAGKGRPGFGHALQSH
jgi:hypothetical protein